MKTKALTMLLVGSLGTGCATWQPVSREALLDMAGQKDVLSRTLVEQGKSTPIEPGMDVRIQTVSGEVGPVSSYNVGRDGDAVVTPGLRLEPKNIQGAEIWDLDRTEREGRVGRTFIAVGATVGAALTVLFVLSAVMANGLHAHAGTQGGWDG